MSTPCNNPCQTIICAKPEDLPFYQLPLPPPRFMNAEVMIEDFCSAGQVPNYSGTDLPSWITLDIVNNRILGAAGTYAGSSQPAANATALAALFQAVSLLAITCVDVGFSCTPFTPHFSWPQAGSDTTEIWRNLNGAGYLQVDTIAGGITVWTDSMPVPSGEIWCYKTRGVVGGTPGAFSTERCAGNDFLMLEVGVVSHPTLTVEYHDCSLDDVAHCTSLNLSGLKCVGHNAYFASLSIVTTIDLSSLVSVGTNLYFSNSSMATLTLPSLTTVVGSLYCEQTPNLTSFSFPVLQTVGGVLAFDQSTALVSISLPALTAVGGDLQFDTSAALVSVSFPALTTVGGNFHGDNCPLLANVSIPLLVFRNGQHVAFSLNSLNVASVNHILARAVASGVTSLTLQLDGGTNAAPAGQGATDKAALILAGNTVVTN